MKVGCSVTDIEGSLRDVEDAERRVEEAERLDLTPGDIAEERHRLNAARVRVESAEAAVAAGGNPR
jgi:hypothetical protein